MLRSVAQADVRRGAAELIALEYWRPGCGACLDRCPYGVPVDDVFRYAILRELRPRARGADQIRRPGGRPSRIALRPLSRTVRSGHLNEAPSAGCATFLCRQRAPFLGHRPLAGFFTGGFPKETGPADDVAFSNVGITYRF